MTCIHGLDELNCPNCRVLKVTLPLNHIKPKKFNFPNISKNAYDRNREIKDELINDITLSKRIPHPPNLLSKPNFINQIPNFRKELFLKRSKDLDIAKEDIQGITKKIPLEKPEWDFEKDK
ncbi:MAG: hypothetical protein ACFE9Z_10485 [Promethearchaeota archaeon]